MTVGRKLLDDAGTPRPEATQRILFLTDMGEMNSVDLGNQIKENAAASVYVSILGMGECRCDKFDCADSTELVRPGIQL